MIIIIIIIITSLLLHNYRNYYDKTNLNKTKQDQTGPERQVVMMMDACMDGDSDYGKNSVK